MEFSKYLHSQGTIQRLTVHNTPEYNGVSERLNRTLLEHTCTLLHSSKLPKNLWGEAINHVTWLKNRTLTHALPEGKTPYKMLYNKKLNMRELQEWGNQVWIHTPSGTKLDRCSKIRRWIGYDKTGNGHRIYWPDKCSVTIERGIKFVNDDKILPSNLINMLIQGESDLISPRNQPYNPKIKPSETETQELTKINEETVIDFVTDKQDQQQQVSVQDQQQQTCQNQGINEP